MYRCNDCGGEFEEPEIYSESRPVGYESFAVSPCCQNTNYEEKLPVKKEIDKYSVAASVIPVIAQLNKQLDSLHESAEKLLGDGVKIGVTPADKMRCKLLDLLTEMAAPAVISNEVDQKLETVTDGQSCEELLAMYADEVGL